MKDIIKSDLISANLSESDHSEPDLDLASRIIAVLKLTDLWSAKNLPIQVYL